MLSRGAGATTRVFHLLRNSGQGLPPPLRHRSTHPSLTPAIPPSTSPKPPSLMVQAESRHASRATFSSPTHPPPGGDPPLAVAMAADRAASTPATAGRGRRGRSGGAATPDDKKSAVLYDDTDWYMSTVVAVHRGGGVTVRFDDGSEERVTLSPGDAETCPDDALAPTPTTTTGSSSGGGSSTPSSSSRSRGARGSGSGRSSLGKSTRTGGRAGGKAVRTLGPGGRVLREGEGAVLTEQRAKALLDTAPERLVGLVYQENHIGYGGWWETTVTEISEKRNQDATISKLWPESVKLGLTYGTARYLTLGRAVLCDDALPRPVPLDSIAAHWRSFSISHVVVASAARHPCFTGCPPTSAARKAPPPSPNLHQRRPRSSTPLENCEKKTIHLCNKGAVHRPLRKAAPAKGASSAVGGSGTAAGGGGEKRKGGGNAAAPHPTPVVAKVVDARRIDSLHGFGRENRGWVDIWRGLIPSSPLSFLKRCDATLKRQQLALKKEAAGERALPTCPFCRCEFYLTETQDQIDRHLASCGPRPAASAVVSTSTPMPPSLSSSLVIGLRGDDLGSLVAAVAELSARGLRPTVTLCDRAMQALYEKDGDDGSGAGVPELPRLPQLFLGAGGDLDGRSAVKRCSKWAAKIWARRYSSVASPATNSGGADGFSAGTNARVCAVASRALGEALEAMPARGGGTRTAAGAVASAAAREATARCRAGLMRSLGARSFCPTLAGVLLENMPTQEDKGGGSDEVEGLKALLRRQQQQRATGAMSGRSAGGREGGQRVRRSLGEKAKSEASGSAMLFADMCHSGTDDL
ncbi:unnamed protein product [Scytosiphon promiscuus]